MRKKRNRRARHVTRFEDHCWKDIVDDESSRSTGVPARREGRPQSGGAGDRSHNKAYQGGARPVREVNRLHSGSCGIHA
jgi:hypothetical protein